MTASQAKGVRGVRLNPSHDLKSRAKIKTSQIVNRLNLFVLKEPDPQTGKPVEMTKTEVSAALGLLRKTLPDLVSAEMRIDDARSLEDMTDAELASIAVGRSLGTPEAEVEPTITH